MQFSLAEVLSAAEASFSQKLGELMAERGIGDAYLAKRANLLRSHMHDIRANALCKPRKAEVLALGVGLELDAGELTALLGTAGYTLSRTDRRDLVVEFFVRERYYDIFDINCALFAFDAGQLG